MDRGAGELAMNIHDYEAMRTTALPLVSVFTDGDNTLKFAEGAKTVYIRLGEKSFPMIIVR